MANSRLPTDIMAHTEAPRRSKAKRKPAKKAKRGKTRVTRKPAATPGHSRMERMTLVLREDQLRWLRREAFEAKDRGERDIDMSAIIRALIDNRMAG